MKECGKNFSQIYELKPGKIYKIFIDVEKLKKLSEYGPFDYVKKCYSDPNDFTLDTRFISENSDNGIIFVVGKINTKLSKRYKFICLDGKIGYDDFKEAVYKIFELE